MEIESVNLGQAHPVRFMFDSHEGSGITSVNRLSFIGRPGLGYYGNQIYTV
jgi:hypothetical protein